MPPPLVERPGRPGPVAVTAAVIIVFALAVSFGAMVRLLLVSTERSPKMQAGIVLSVLVVLVYVVRAARRLRRIGRRSLSPSGRLMESLVREQKAAQDEANAPKEPTPSTSESSEPTPSPSESPEPPTSPPAP